MNNYIMFYVSNKLAKYAREHLRLDVYMFACVARLIEAVLIISVPVSIIWLISFF